MGYLVLWLDLVGVSEKGLVYDWLLSMCRGSFIVRFREMVGVFAPSSLVNASRRVWSILGWSSVVSAFSFATR